VAQLTADPNLSGSFRSIVVSLSSGPPYHGLVCNAIIKKARIDNGRMAISAALRSPKEDGRTREKR
jgi:hypothetical protein